VTLGVLAVTWVISAMLVLLKARGRGKAVLRTRRSRALAWLAAIDIAAGLAAIVVVRSITAKSPVFAIIVAAVIVGALPLYFLPVIIAYLRAVPDRARVAAINVFLGWTYLGWVAALALAIREPAFVIEPEMLPDHVTNGRPAGWRGEEQGGHGQFRSARTRGS